MLRRKYKKMSAILLAAAMTAAAPAVFAAQSGDSLDFSDYPAAEMPAFTAKDLDGNEITEQIFSEKDITMVNIWGTFCSPCVNEMPELAEIAESMPENQQMIGLVIDVTDESDPNYELAKKILEKAGASFTQIIANEDFTDLLNNVTGVPTTIFVDKDGNVLGEAILGNDTDEYKKRLEEYSEQFPAESASEAESKDDEA